MNKDLCFFLGIVSKPFGFKGEVILFLDSDSPENYQDMESVFLEIKGKLIPFFIESSRPHAKNNQIVVRFQDIDTEEKAQGLVGCELFMPLSALPHLSGNKFYFHEVIGFTVIDEVYGKLGIIDTVLEYPNNPIFQILHGEKEVLIPIADHIIKNVDRPNKTITVRAPEGLIDVYLSA